VLTFPILKTGVTVQYPLGLAEGFGTDVLQFMAGDEQRYPTSPAPLRKWAIKLDLLDEAELRSIEAFFVAATGSFGTFIFVDPISGISYPNCFIGEDSLNESFAGELNARLSLVIKQGKS
jgi:hypothetical protein